MRGAVRRPDFAGRYEVYLYDLEQAEALRSYLVGEGITGDVTLVPVIEAQIMDVHRETSNFGRAETSVQVGRAEKRRADAAGRQRRRRKRQRTENGVEPRGPGRPRKV